MSVKWKLEFLSLGLCLLTGGTAAALVYLGDYFEWPNFNRRSGYFGTHYLAPFLYAINDPYAIHIVSALWFVSVALPIYICSWFIRKCRPRK